MRTVWKIAVCTTVLLIVSRSGSAAEPSLPTLPPATAPGQPASGQPATDGLAMDNASSAAPVPVLSGPQPSALVQFFSGPTWHAPISAGPTACASCCTDGGCSDNCGKRQRKVARFLDWLIYRPLDGGKTKCCQICNSTPPPAWAFFPCEKSGHCGCSAVAGQGPMYYAKEPESTTANQVVQTAYPPVAPPQPPPPPVEPKPAATSKPGGIAKSMPVLDPSQYRRLPNGN